MKKTINIPNFPDLDFNLIEGGSFIMGDDKSDDEREKPAHKVQIAPFYMAKYLVTQRLYAAVMDENPSGFIGDLRPVENVSWNDAKAFIDAINNKAKHIDNYRYRLPSEAEWEYAASGGKHSQHYKYAGSDQLTQVGWYNKNSGNKTKEVGLLLPNELGLYDMSGNVWEWCEDDWNEDYNGAPEKEKAWIDTPERSTDRVFRGGGYFGSAVCCRSMYRSWYAPDDRIDNIGFRLVLSVAHSNDKIISVRYGYNQFQK